MSDPTPTTNPLAIASVICGGTSCITAWICCYGFPFNVLGLVLGIVAIAQINADPSQEGKNLAQGGIALSVLSVVMVVGLVLFAIVFGVGFSVFFSMLGVFAALMGNA